MIPEQAHLDVIPDQEAAFEAAFDDAKLVISAMPGFRSLRPSRCVERPNRTRGVRLSILGGEAAVVLGADRAYAHETNVRPALAAGQAPDHSLLA
jgi:heme-degrading monooxygenase HmoA